MTQQEFIFFELSTFKQLVLMSTGIVTAFRYCYLPLLLNAPIWQRSVFSNTYHPPSILLGLFVMNESFDLAAFQVMY